MKYLKFRLIKDGKVVGYERWNQSAKRWEYWKNRYGAPVSFEFIDHDYKDMFTGRVDYEGVEIYENDLVQIEGNPVKKRIVFDEGGFMVQNSGKVRFKESRVLSTKKIRTQKLLKVGVRFKNEQI